MNMKLKIEVVAALAFLLPLSGARAEDANCCCPRCHVVCVPSREIEQQKHTAFDVECKWICVPKIRFPWESCCEPKCAWVRKAKTLKKVEYECPHCKYTWTAVCECPSCQSGACPPGACPSQGHQSLGIPPVPKATSDDSTPHASTPPASARRLLPAFERLFGPTR